jgi:hypothetical protein
MGVAIELSRVADLSAADRDALRALSSAVYPPGESTNWAGRRIEWSAAEWCVCVRDAGGALASYVGISLRDAKRDDSAVRVGGIGGVKTHPASRRRGLASAGIDRALQFFRDQRDVDFALLVCGTHLLDYYRALGWRDFAGRLWIRQHGATEAFTFNRVMTRAVRSDAPETGTIDLLGPPW